MSTASLVIDANQSGIDYTADLNAGLAAINTCHSGSSAPTTEVVAGKLWLDTSGTNPVLKIYRSGWKSLFTLNSTSVSTSVSALTAASVSISGTSTFTGLITANGGISGTTGTFSGNISVGGVTGNLSVTGDVTAVDGTFSGQVSAVDFDSTSDRRLKTNINNIENALDKVKALQGVSFKMNNQDKIGLIAQDTQEVIPEVVNENKEGYLSVSYGNIVGLLIEAIKEQQVKIESLEKKLGE
jgi:hypothetical protein